MSGAQIDARKLTCGFGPATVLREVSLRLPAGRTVALVGPGGAGKSTLLKMCAGAAVDGEGFWWRGELSVAEGPVAYLPQKPDRCASSLADLLLEATGGRADAVDLLCGAWEPCPQAVIALLSVLDLPISSLPKPLARLGMITAILARPAVRVLLDEPDADLDAPFLAWLVERLVGLRGSTSLLVATHNLRFAREVSDHAVLMVEGEVVESGPTSELFAAPREARTETFLRWGS